MQKKAFNNISWRCHFDRQVGQIIFYTFLLTDDSQIEMIFLNVIVVLKGEGSPLWRFKMPIIHQKIIKIKNN